MKATLSSLDADLEDLEESVRYAMHFRVAVPWLDIYLLTRIVESTGARMFGLDDGEVIQRRRYVGHVRNEIEVRGA